MTCDVCQQKMNYCFYINEGFWAKAVGKREGHWCAHCILEQLGGLEWYITWNEPSERIRHNLAEVERDATASTTQQTR